AGSPASCASGRAPSRARSGTRGSGTDIARAAASKRAGQDPGTPDAPAGDGSSAAATAAARGATTGGSKPPGGGETDAELPCPAHASRGRAAAAPGDAGARARANAVAVTVTVTVTTGTRAGRAGA